MVFATLMFTVVVNGLADINKSLVDAVLVSLFIIGKVP
jgi:hypothetical protein